MSNLALPDHVGIRRHPVLPLSKCARNLLDNAEATPARMSNLALQDHVGIRRHLLISRREGYYLFPSIELRKRQHLEFPRILSVNQPSTCFAPVKTTTKSF
jgi:hypothetical protein